MEMLWECCADTYCANMMMPRRCGDVAVKNLRFFKVSSNPHLAQQCNPARLLLRTGLLDDQVPDGDRAGVHVLS